MSFADRFEMEEHLFQGLVATVCGDTGRARDVEMRFLRAEGITEHALAQVNLRVDLTFRRCPVMTTEDTFDEPSHVKRNRKGGYKVIRHDGRTTNHDEAEVRIMRCRYLLCDQARHERSRLARGLGRIALG